jgi:hypothetical protein
MGRTMPGDVTDWIMKQNSVMHVSLFYGPSGRAVSGEDLDRLDAEIVGSNSS